MRLCVLSVLFCASVFIYGNAVAGDRVNVQIEFRKAIWTCPKCGQEDIEDRNVGGGDSYEHVCSKCGAKFNQSGANMREYNGVVKYTPEDYNKLKEEDLSKTKSDVCNTWLYSVKNPPAYVEPSKSDYTNLYNEKMKEAKEYLGKLKDKCTSAELESIKADAIVDITNVRKEETVR